MKINVFCEPADIKRVDYILGLLLQKANIRAHKRVCDDLEAGAQADVSILYRNHISADDVRCSKNISKVVLIVNKKYTDAELPDPDKVSFLSSNFVKLEYDLFQTIFYYITCQPERELESQDKPVNSLESRLGLGSEGFYRRPFLNSYFNKFESLLRKIANNAGIDISHIDIYPSGKQFALAMTHDVDIINDSVKQRVKQFIHFSNRLKNVFVSKAAPIAKEESTAFHRKIYGRRLDYFQVYDLMKFERSNGFSSSFYIFSRVRRAAGVGITDSLVNWLYNPGYDISRNVHFQKCIGDLVSGGWEVGLHSSYGTFDNGFLLKLQKNILEAVAGTEVFGCRQHFLNIELDTTWRLQKAAGLKYDSTLGFRHSNGFRAGVAHPFYPYDMQKDEHIDLLQIPLVIMDSTFFDRCHMKPDDAVNEIERLLRLIKDSSGAVAINWHQNFFNEALFPHLKMLYKFIIDWAAANNGYMTTAKDVFDLWTGSSALQKKQGA